VTRVALEIPKVGLVMENARLVRWLKNVGDVVKQGDPLLELETEKSLVEIESTESGRLVEILVHADQEARVGDQVAWLENDAPAAAVAVSRIKSSPVARRLAAENSLDLSRIAGTGPRGRVQLIDVRQAIETRSGGHAARPAPSSPASSSPASSDPVSSGSSGSQGLSSMRRAVARSMTLSNATVPQFIVERAVDWTAINAIRAKLLAQLPQDAPRPSINDFLLQGIARTLLAVAALNATFRGDPNSPDASIVPASGAHIGLVVAVENGLRVPVFHGVEQFGLLELARRRREAVERAVSGRLKREELEGATISVSNLGARGPDRFTAIIDPPQSAILAVGRQRDCVVALDGGVHVRPMSQLTLTVDHRVADGRLAAEFLASLVEIVEGHTWRVD
jgi:pyruvate dehydrogenase E2 component (dihydrolipoamide acetyltransferase)